MLLCSVGGMCLILLSLFFIPDPAAGISPVHPTFASTMFQGDIGVDRHAGIRWLGLVFVLLQATFFVCVLFLGTRQRGLFSALFTVGGLVYAGTFIALVIAHRAYATGDAQDIVLGFPVPTAIMMYGIVGVPVFFSAVYYVKFDDWVMKPEDLQRINDLAERKRQTQAEGSH